MRRQRQPPARRDATRTQPRSPQRNRRRTRTLHWSASHGRLMMEVGFFAGFVLDSYFGMSGTLSVFWWSLRADE